MGNFSHATNQKVFQIVHALNAISDLLGSTMKARKVEEAVRTSILGRLNLMPSGAKAKDSLPGVAASWWPSKVYGIRTISLCLFEGHLSVALDVLVDGSPVAMQLEAELDDLTGPNSYCSPNWNHTDLAKAITVAEESLFKTFYTIPAEVESPAKGLGQTGTRAFVV